MGGDVKNPLSGPFLITFQSTPPHGGRPRELYIPTKGVYVSIHAPAWGATSAGWIITFRSVCFNPRPRMGGDRDVGTLTKIDSVSIHAPAWGATERRFNGPNSWGSFNPRPRMGGDAILSTFRLQHWRFQSTPPHGGRRRMMESTPYAGDRVPQLRTSV